MEEPITANCWRSARFSAARFEEILVFDHMTKTRYRNGYITILDWQEHEFLSIISERTNISEGQDSVVVIAGDRYGMGSSRDWAAKGQRMLGIRAVMSTLKTGLSGTLPCAKKLSHPVQWKVQASRRQKR